MGTRIALMVTGFCRARWLRVLAAAVALLVVSLTLKVAFSTVAPAAFETVAFDSAGVLGRDLDRGLDPNATDHWGTTLLHAAAGRGDLAKVALLIEHGANPNAQDAHLQTPLHVAATTGSSDVCRYLLAHGARVSLRDGRGDTPLDLARGQGHSGVVRLLVPALRRAAADGQPGAQGRDSRGQ